MGSANCLTSKTRMETKSGITFYNASHHHTPSLMDFFQKQKVQVMFTALHSFELSPIEKVFAFVKSGDLSMGNKDFKIDG